MVCRAVRSGVRHEGRTVANGRKLQAVVRRMGKLRQRGRKNFAGILPTAGFPPERFGIRKTRLDLHGNAWLRGSLSHRQRQVSVVAGSGSCSIGNFQFKSLFFTTCKVMFRNKLV